jgi:hypothetical protein
VGVYTAALYACMILMRYLGMVALEKDQNMSVVLSAERGCIFENERAWLDMKDKTPTSL